VAVQAYILIQTEVGKAAEVVSRIADLPGITRAEDVTGPYDIIVRAEAGDMDELGRLVVDPGHRSGTVVALLWAALLQYLSEGGYRYLMGCVSIPLNGDGPRGTELRGVRDIARNRYAAPWQVYPHRKVTVDGAGLDALEPPTADRIPPLLRAYLRLGARVCGEPALDEAFDVGDLLVVLDRELADERYVARLRSAAQRLSGKTN